MSKIKVITIPEPKSRDAIVLFLRGLIDTVCEHEVYEIKLDYLDKDGWHRTGIK